MSVITLSVAGSALVFGADANTASYPHQPATISESEAKLIEPIFIVSETTAAPEIEAIIVAETVTQPETEASTEETEPVQVIEAVTETEPVREVYLTDEERQMMAQLVHSEAGTESYKVKRFVVDVVFNRVDSPKWPNTIKDVIFQHRQFSVIRNESFYSAADELTEDDWLAVDDETYGRLDYGIQYFNDDSIGGCANGKGGWKIGHMWFAY